MTALPRALTARMSNHARTSGKMYPMQTHQLTVRTGGQLVTDLTADIQSFCRPLGDGLLHVFAPHATAGLALIELGSGSETDLAELVSRLAPRDNRWTHRHGSPGHGGDHVLPALIAPALMLAVSDGCLALGPWQSVVLVDPNGDNPVRTVQLSFLAG